MKALRGLRPVGRILAARLHSSGLRGGLRARLVAVPRRAQLWSMLLRRRLRLRSGDVARGTRT